MSGSNTQGELRQYSCQKERKEYKAFAFTINKIKVAFAFGVGCFQIPTLVFRKAADKNHKYPFVFPNKLFCFH